MINELIEFCKELFPGISPYTAEETKKAYNQFKNEGKTFCCTMSSSLDYLAQGDIFSNVPFVFVDDKGNQRVMKTKGMLLTNTCDCSRNKNLQFAAIFNLEDFSNKKSEIDGIISNKTYQFLYMPDPKTENIFTDFGLISSCSRTLFEKMIKCGKTEKIASLSQIGYYILITKLTIFL